MSSGLRPNLRVLGERAMFGPTAACYGSDTALFFPESEDEEAIEPVKAICRGCRWRGDCLDYALRNNVTDGIWGATSPKDRRQIVRIRRARERQQR